MITGETYRPKDDVDLRDLMARKIGPRNNECIYLGELIRGDSKQDCYHCFSTTVFVGKDYSISILEQQII